jgi:hypothetical protein
MEYNYVPDSKLYEDIGYLKHSVESLNIFVRDHMYKEEKANARLTLILASLGVGQIVTLASLNYKVAIDTVKSILMFVL